MDGASVNFGGCGGASAFHGRWFAKPQAAEEWVTTFRTWRDIPATVEQVFAAISDPARLARWWGPAGFTNTFDVCEFVPGGQWSFTMHGPDGRSYPNESVFAEVARPRLVVVEHVSEPVFRLTIELTASGEGTRVSWAQAFESAEVARGVESIVVPANEQNLDRLSAEVLRGVTGRVKIMSETNPKVDAYVNRAKQWQAETKKLRSIVLGCGLSEDLKWGKPCYAFEEGNVVILQGFKGYCALLFFKGVLMKDPKGLLVKTGENTHVGRQIRFTQLKEIVALEPVLKSYIRQAIEVEKSGVKVDAEPKPELVLVEELRRRLDEMPKLKGAFEALTPGRQRGYNIYFAGAKQAKTREARVEKCVGRILEGKGLLDDD